MSLSWLARLLSDLGGATKVRCSNLALVLRSCIVADMTIMMSLSLSLRSQETEIVIGWCAGFVDIDIIIASEGMSEFVHRFRHYSFLVSVVVVLSSQIIVERRAKHMKIFKTHPISPVTCVVAICLTIEVVHDSSRPSACAHRALAKV